MLPGYTGEAAKKMQDGRYSRGSRQQNDPLAVGSYSTMRVDGRSALTHHFI
jgi:hypothetical protein